LNSKKFLFRNIARKAKQKGWGGHPSFSGNCESAFSVVLRRLELPFVLALACFDNNGTVIVLGTGFGKLEGFSLGIEKLDDFFSPGVLQLPLSIARPFGENVGFSRIAFFFCHSTSYLSMLFFNHKKFRKQLQENLSDYPRDSWIQESSKTG